MKDKEIFINLIKDKIPDPKEQETLYQKVQQEMFNPLIAKKKEEWKVETEKVITDLKVNNEKEVNKYKQELDENKLSISDKNLTMKSLSDKLASLEEKQKQLQEERDNYNQQNIVRKYGEKLKDRDVEDVIVLAKYRMSENKNLTFEEAVKNEIKKYGIDKKPATSIYTGNVETKVEPKEWVIDVFEKK